MKTEQELHEAIGQVLHLSELVKEGERTEQLYELQTKTLKSEIRELQKAVKRNGIDMQYLKNIIVKYMETEEHEVRFVKSNLRKHRKCYLYYQPCFSSMTRRSGVSRKSNKNGGNPVQSGFIDFHLDNFVQYL